ncbi:MAG: efflux RND transporter periplasmic adaptor subunit [Spirochaetaceae bacterium]|jgi:multidrug efflux pump subunit AcrA (membrane-fusion protein)|nr:efflux RND transporter periplasmic adaptor subunit [Spirochaetaceae bacterium]
MKNNRISRMATALLVLLIMAFTALIAYYLGINQASAEGATGVPGTGSPQATGGSGSGQGASGSSGNLQAGQVVRSATVVRTTELDLGTIENSVVVNGDVLARTQVAIYPTVAGKLSERYFRVGDTVRQGEVVALVDPSRPGEVYSQSPVISTITGTVLSAPVNPGDTLSTQTAVYVLGDLGGLTVETFVPERFATAMRQGLAAQVSFEAIPGEFFGARIDEVSPVLDPASRTLRIRLRFTGTTDPRIRAGMFATVSLVTSTRTNVLVIPRGAVINTYGSWIVFTVDGEGIARRREIRPGLGDEESVEVVDGLELGEQVVIAGQNFLSEGEPVRVVE